MKPVNVVCIKWGTKFGPEYVNNLYHMVRRNITLPFRFICLTEISAGFNEAIEVLPLPIFKEPPPEYLKKCLAWRKLALFGKHYHDIKGKVLLLDLDVVIVDNIDCFFTYSDKLCMAENWSQPGRMIGQGSVICFEMGKHSQLLEQWEKDPASVYKNFRTEQPYLPQVLGKEGSEWFPVEWVRSFKAHCMPGGILNSFVTPKKEKIPKGARIIAFHGNPNPPDAIAGVWGAPVPWYKKWYKTVKQTQWIAEYWCE
jgi:hypothetical protein